MSLKKYWCSIRKESLDNMQKKWKMNIWKSINLKSIRDIQIKKEFPLVFIH